MHIFELNLSGLIVHIIAQPQSPDKLFDCTKKGHCALAPNKLYLTDQQILTDFSAQECCQNWDRVKELSGTQFAMDIHFRESGKVTVAELSGEIDGKSAAVAQEKILPLVKDNCRLVLDFSRVSSMSGNGLRFLLTLRRQVPYSGNLVLASLPQSIKDSMAITGFLDLFTIFETQQEAVKFLS